MSMYFIMCRCMFALTCAHHCSYFSYMLWVGMWDVANLPLISSVWPLLAYQCQKKKPMIFKWLWSPCDIPWSCIWCEYKWMEMKHEIRVEWPLIPSLLPAGPQMEPSNPFLSAPQAKVRVSFHYPLLQPCHRFLGPSLVSWERVQQQSSGKCDLRLSWYNTQSPKKHIPLLSLPQRSSLFPSDGLF